MYNDNSLEQLSLVFVDVETTGLEPRQGDSICEIGAVKCVEEGVVEEFHSLINPKRTIPPYISQINNIFDEDVKDAPYFEEVAGTFFGFLNNSILCGYNVGFDLGFLNTELERIHYSLLNLPALDVLFMARRTFTGLAHYNLGYIAQYFHLEIKKLHRAFEDALLTSKIYFLLKKELAKKGISKIKEHLTLFGVQNEFFKNLQEPKALLIKESIIAEVTLRITCLSYHARTTLVMKPRELVDRNGLSLVGVEAETQKTIILPLNRLINIEIF